MSALIKTIEYDARYADSVGDAIHGMYRKRKEYYIPSRQIVYSFTGPNGITCARGQHVCFTLDGTFLPEHALDYMHKPLVTNVKDGPMLSQSEVGALENLLLLSEELTRAERRAAAMLTTPPGL